ncbi:hypothetical protein PSY81_23910, partial [Shigella flexneri]|nr:hypothetical protein [Shigella flexneri]
GQKEGRKKMSIPGPGLHWQGSIGQCRYVFFVFFGKFGRRLIRKEERRMKKNFIEQLYMSIAGQ